MPYESTMHKQVDVRSTWMMHTVCADTGAAAVCQSQCQPVRWHSRMPAQRSGLTQTVH